MNDRALTYLLTNPLLHMGMIFPIRRGSADILYAGDDGVFLKEQESGAYMLSVCLGGKEASLLDSVGEQALYCVHQQSAVDRLMRKYPGFHLLTCHQAVYTKREPLTLRGCLDIHPLHFGDSARIFAHYNEHVDQEYIVGRLERGAIFGGFADGELCGFVGTHAEGSIGILEVFAPYRKRGYGAELEGFMVNRILEDDQIPFAQITTGNAASMRLHSKLGFEITDDVLHWQIRM